MLPDLLKKIVDNIKITIDQPIEEEAIINVFMAKFCSVMACKQITTNSNLHIEPVPLQYYALNLLPSGMGKNKLKSAVDQLFEWHKLNCQSANNWFIDREKERIDKIYKDTKSREKAYKEIPEYSYELNGASSQEVYEISKWIINNNFGSLFFFNTEFAKMFTDKTDYNNILELSLNGADGIIDYVSVVSNRRKTLEQKISMSIYFATAYEKLLDPVINKEFIELGNTGFFRRSYIYFLNNTNVKNLKPYTAEEKSVAKNNLKECEKVLKDIYSSITSNTELVFSKEADIAISNYRKELNKEIIKNFNYSEYLLPKDESYKINLINSPWKIVKTAFIIHLLENPRSKTVTESTVLKAIDFFNMFNRFLIEFLNKKTITYRDCVLSYVLKNLNKKIDYNEFLNDIRNLIYSDIDYKEWSEIKKDLVNYIKEDVQQEGIYISNKNDIIKFYKKNKDIDTLNEL